MARAAVAAPTPATAGLIAAATAAASTSSNSVGGCASAVVSTREHQRAHESTRYTKEHQVAAESTRESPRTSESELAKSVAQGEMHVTTDGM